MPGQAPSVQTTTVTGKWLDLDGNPCTGVVQFEPGPCTITVAADNAFMQGTVTAQLDGNGAISVALPCPDQTTVNPQDWTYKVTERISCQNCPVTYYIALPCSTTPVDLSDLAPIDSNTGTAVVVGPQGPKGDTGATGATGPQGPAGLGSVVADDDTITVDDRTPEFGVKVDIAAVLAQVALDGLPPIIVSGAGTTADPWQVELEYSADPGNRARNGTDGGLLVPAAAVQGAAPIQISGAGTDVSPYVAALLLSADAHNRLKLGSDNGLFATDEAYWSGSLTTTTAATTAFTTIPLNQSSSSGAADFTRNADGTVTVLKAGNYDVHISVRHNVTATAVGSVGTNLLGVPSSFGSVATLAAGGTYMHTIAWSGPLVAGTILGPQARLEVGPTADSIQFANMGIRRLDSPA